MSGQGSGNSEVVVKKNEQKIPEKAMLIFTSVVLFIMIFWGLGIAKNEVNKSTPKNPPKASIQYAAQTMVGDHQPKTFAGKVKQGAEFIGFWGSVAILTDKVFE